MQNQGPMQRHFIQCKNVHSVWTPPTRHSCLDLGPNLAAPPHPSPKTPTSCSAPLPAPARQRRGPVSARRSAWSRCDVSLPRASSKRSGAPNPPATGKRHRGSWQDMASIPPKAEDGGSRVGLRSHEGMQSDSTSQKGLGLPGEGPEREREILFI